MRMCEHALIDMHVLQCIMRCNNVKEKLLTKSLVGRIKECPTPFQLCTADNSKTLAEAR